MNKQAGRHYEGWDREEEVWCGMNELCRQSKDCLLFPERQGETPQVLGFVLLCDSWCLSAVRGCGSGQVGIAVGCDRK